MPIANIQSFVDFWTFVVGVWDDGFMGAAITHIALALFIFVLAIAIRCLFSTAVLRRIRLRLLRADTDPHDAVIQALAPPIRFLPIVLAVFIISEFVTANPQIKAIFSDVTRSLTAFAIFWALFEVIEPLLSFFDGRSAVFSPVMIGWAVKVGRILVAALGAAAIMEIWGIQVGPILAGLGLFGVAVALGAQDLFKNLIAGIFIIGERRFQNGDWILADGIVEGTVESIGLRTTKVRRSDMAPVYVPNSKLADSAVTNFAQMTYRRISWIVGLEYGTTVDQLRCIRDSIEAYILGNADFAHPPEAPAFVRVDKFNESSIDLMVDCFTRTTDRGEWLKIKEALAYAIKGFVEAAGSDFAFPSRTLYVETLPAGAELFPSPAPAAVCGEKTP